MPEPGTLHHVELYVSDLRRSTEFWGWFLPGMGYVKFQQWDSGISWKRGDTYIVFVQADAKYKDTPYHRKHVGLNHLAFHGSSKESVDELAATLKGRGIEILYNDQSRSRESKSYAIFFEDPDRVKVEFVAPEQQASSSDTLHEAVFGGYQVAAGLGATVELKLRLLASRTTELRQIAHDRSLESVETQVLQHFASRFTPQEKELLAYARGLRNKILHSDFKSAASKTQAITGEKPTAPSVSMLDLSTGEVMVMPELSKSQGGVFGWMLECTQTGVFIEAASIFEKACTIYDRVMFEAATEGIPPEDFKKMRPQEQPSEPESDDD